MKAVPVESLTALVGECSSRYNKPMEDRTWKWALAFTDFAPEGFRFAFANLLCWRDPAKAMVIEQTRSFQT